MDSEATDEADREGAREIVEGILNDVKTRGDARFVSSRRNSRQMVARKAFRLLDSGIFRR